MSFSNDTSSRNLYGEIQLYGGTGCPELSQKISNYLGVPLSGRDVIDFPNENILVQLHNSARGQDVYVIQTTSRPVHRNIMELLIMLQTLQLDSAARVTAVIPHLTYARSDKKDQPRIPITARLLTDMIEIAGADRYITCDLHAGQIQGFFSIPGDVLTAFHLITDYLGTKVNDMIDPVVVTTDLGFAKRARNVAAKLNIPLALIEKRRATNNSKSEAVNIVGNVSGSDVFLVDDEVDTAGSVQQAVNLLMANGANSVTMACVHPVLSGPAATRLKDIPLTEFITTDTIPITQEIKEVMGDRLTVLSVASLLGEVIRRAHEGRSVGAMFNE
ncbi:MAG: ribose-phosphate diphosphokinase [Anaerolineales bacterium]|nr:ribose-phosphate diphosphokinase [Anaerolineales bacterium]